MQKLKTKFIELAIALSPLRNLVLIIALSILSLVFISAVFKQIQLKQYEIPLLLVGLWGLVVYFYIASFSLLAEKGDQVDSWSLRIKYWFANLFCNLLLLILAGMLMVSMYLAIRLLSI